MRRIHSRNMKNIILLREFPSSLHSSFWISSQLSSSLLCILCYLCEIALHSLTESINHPDPRHLNIPFCSIRYTAKRKRSPQAMRQRIEGNFPIFLSSSFVSVDVQTRQRSSNKDHRHCLNQSNSSLIKLLPLRISSLHQRIYQTNM